MNQPATLRSMSHQWMRGSVNLLSELVQLPPGVPYSSHKHTIDEPL
jgi:hypothetical protein